MKSLVNLLFLAMLLPQLSACGSKGSLTLPDQKPAESQKTSK